MTPHSTDNTIAAARADASRALTEYDQARSWLDGLADEALPPLAAEVWLTNQEGDHVLLVEHRWRGWVAPGGRAEPEEAPRDAAQRELFEETGVRAQLPAVPAAVCLRSYHADWSPTLGLIYTAVADRTVPLRGEPGQRAAWKPLDTEWGGAFPQDRGRILAHLGRAGVLGPA